MPGGIDVDHLARRRRLAELLLAACPDLHVVGSVAAGRADPSDLDVVVPPRPDAVSRVLAALDDLGAWWPSGQRSPRVEDLIAAAFGRCTTAYGPVDLFVRAPR